eukprot:3293098-Amphidinium_carterae.5
MAVARITGRASEANWQLMFAALSLVVHYDEVVDRPPPASHDVAVRLSQEAFGATNLDRHVAVCEKQKKICSKVLGLYLSATSDARSCKKRKLITGL